MPLPDGLPGRDGRGTIEAIVSLAAADPNRPQDIVGRQGLIDELAGAEPTLGTPCIFVLRAPAGMGRSSVLASLRARLAGDGRETLRAALGGFRDDRATDDESNTRERKKGRNVLNYRRLLEALAADLAGAEGFAAKARELVRGADSELQLELAKDELQQAFLEELQHAEAAPLALLFDDYSAVADEELALWIVELIERVGSRRPVLAVATTVGLADVPRWLPPQIEIRNLEPFTRTEIADLLERALPGVSLAPDWPAAVERWCGGYPAAVSVAIELAGRWPRRPEFLEDDEPPSELEGLSRPLFDQVLASAESDAERAALEVAAVARRFDGVLLRTQVADAELVAPPDLESRLARYPFVVTQGDPSEPEYHVYPFVRHVGTLELQSQPPRGSFGGVSRLAEIRQRALHFYSERVKEEAQRRGQGYELEDPKNQEALLEFLHYAALFEDRPVARYMLAEAYLTAFWWWGWYIESAFCIRELDEWERTRPRGDDAEFLRALRAFHDAYPPCFERFLVRAHGNSDAVAEAMDSDWEAVGDALDRISDLIELDKSQLDSKLELRAIIDVFRAHSLRGRRHARTYDAQIDRLYESARAGFDASSDYQWSVVWVLFDVADTALERGAWKQAEERAADALRTAVKDEDLDREVVADLHRVLGDASYERGAHARAFEHYGRALVTAWEFQARPIPGDEYTRGLYEEQTTRVRLRLDQLRAADPRAADAAADALRELWAPYFAETGSTAPGLYPPVPAPTDLVAGSEYLQRVMRLAPVIAQRSEEQRGAAAGRPMLKRMLRPGRGHEPAAAPQPVADAAAPVFAAPTGPVEAAELFEPGEHPLWPGSWREFPAAWADPADRDPAEVNRRVRMAIDELPEGWRLVLQRRDVDGWSSDAVARRFAIPGDEQTVILHHARASIRRSLAQYFAGAEA